MMQKNIWVNINSNELESLAVSFIKAKKVRECYFNKRYKSDIDYFNTIYSEYKSFVCQENKNIINFYKERYGNKKHLKLMSDQLNPFIKFYLQIKIEKKENICYLPKIVDVEKNLINI